MARKSTSQRRAEKEAAQAAERARQARQARIRGLSVGIGSLLAIGLLLFLIWPEPDTGNTTRNAWNLPALEGAERIAIEDFRGKPTVVAFYASWCEVCEEEMPAMLALSEQIGDRVNFVGINTQDNGQGLGDARKWGIADAWPIARDINNGNGSALSVVTFGARGSPANVIYDASGAVVHVELGGLSNARLITLLESLTDFQA